MNQIVSSPPDLETLRHSIRSNDVVDITRVALCVARDRAMEFAEAHPSDAAGVIEAMVTRGCTAALQAPTGVDLSHGARAGLLRAMDAAMQLPLEVGNNPRRAKEALVAQSLALVLETAFGSRFFGHLAPGGPRDLGADDLLVYVSPFSEGSAFFTEYKKTGLAPAPANLTTVVPGRLHSRGRLAPKLPHGARLRWDPSWTALDALTPESLAAVVVPGTYALKYDMDQATMRFSNAAPADPAAASVSALQLVRRADDAGTAIVVLPELCLDENGAKELASWVEAQAKNLVLAVCGSHHRSGAHGWDNIALVAQPGRPGARLEQPKVRPFTLRMRNPKREYVEDIGRAGPCLTLLSGRSISVLPLICIDFLDKDLRRACEDLQPALVLIAACSATMGGFEADARALAINGQAHVVIANQDQGGPREAVALMARPRRASICTKHRPANGPPPNVWLAPLAPLRGRRRWRPCP